MRCVQLHVCQFCFVIAGCRFSVCPSLALLRLSIPPWHACCPSTIPIPTPLQYGYTPLHKVADSGHLDSVRLLLDRGADKEAKDKVRGEGGAVDGRCVAMQCVVDDEGRGPVAEEARRARGTS